MWKTGRLPEFVSRRKRKEERALLIRDSESAENGDDEFLDESSAPRYSDVNELDTAKKWRTVKIGTPVEIIDKKKDHEPICVFPKGIHLILASNPSESFTPNQTTAYRILIQFQTPLMSSSGSPFRSTEKTQTSGSSSRPWEPYRVRSFPQNLRRERRARRSGAASSVSSPKSFCLMAL